MLKSLRARSTSSDNLFKRSGDGFPLGLSHIPRCWSAPTKRNKYISLLKGNIVQWKITVSDNFWMLINLIKVDSSWSHPNCGIPTLACHLYNTQHSLSMIYDIWYMMIYDNIWWHMMIYDDIWWYMMCMMIVYPRRGPGQHMYIRTTAKTNTKN